MTAKQNLALLFLLPLAILTACSSDKNKANMETRAEQSAQSEPPAESAMDSVSPQSGSLALPPAPDLKKFIRTADLRFKVNDVDKSTQAIEDLVHRYNGVVTQSNLESRVEDSRMVRKNEDSVVVITNYVMENQMVLRVPNIAFDTVLKSLRGQYIFLDSRRVSASDPSLDMLENKMRAQNAEYYQKRLEKIGDKTKPNYQDGTQPDLQAAAMGETAISRQMDNLRAADKVQYSTVTLSVYQDAQQIQVTRPDLSPDRYSPSFGQRLKSALATGAQIIQGLVVGLVTVWPIILLGLIIWLLYRQGLFRRRRSEA